MKNNKIPMRKCIGCMESKPKQELIRIAGYMGEASVDVTGKAKGRGVYLCKSAACRELAKKKRAIGRGLDISLTPEQTEKLFEELEKYEK